MEHNILKPIKLMHTVGDVLVCHGRQMIPIDLRVSRSKVTATGT